MRRAFVALCILAMLLAGCGVKLPDHIDLPTQLTGGDPKTLDAATKAAQEIADRQTSGDFAGVWLMMSRQVRDKISQADYVILQNACTKTGLPIHVTGVRMEGTDEAITRWNLDLPVLSGFKTTQPMLYESGKWVLAPDPDYAPDYGLPVQQIIAKRKATGHCDNDVPATTSLTPSPSPTPTPTITWQPVPPGEEPQWIPPAGSCSVDDPSCDRYGECHPVVTGNIDCFPEDESCSKPGNTFPWCAPPTPGIVAPTITAGQSADDQEFVSLMAQEGWGCFNVQSPQQCAEQMITYAHQACSFSGLSYAEVYPKLGPEFMAREQVRLLMNAQQAYPNCTFTGSP